MAGVFDLNRLQSILLQSGIQTTNNALYQVIQQLIAAVKAEQNRSLTTGGGGSADVNALKNRTYWTETNETAVLPVSRQVFAGSGITLDYSVASQVTVGAGNIAEVGYWTPLTDGDLDETDLIFADGECIAVFVPTP